MAKRSFADAFAKYKTYDPSKEGYGDESQWGAAFDHRMGMDEAHERLKADNPLSILGLTVMPATLVDLKQVYRKLIMKNQEALRGNASEEQQTMIRRIIAAYTVLEDRLTKAKK